MKFEFFNTIDPLRSVAIWGSERATIGIQSLSKQAERTDTHLLHIEIIVHLMNCFVSRSSANPLTPCSALYSILE